MNQWVLDRLKVWKDSPLQFVQDCIEAVPSDQQAEALYKFPKVNRMSIRSGHGTGKDACASWIILWFMATRAYSKVVCTAPTNRQLADILWSELSKWLRRSKFQDEFIIQKDKMFHKDAPKEWWARAVSPSVKANKEEQAETLAGFHGDHLLIVADEASGIPDPVFIPLEGALTQEDNRVLLIGNMTQNMGYFYDSHFHPKISQVWETLHWDSRKSSNVKPSYPQYMKDKYGEESNIFRIRVMGDPPLESENTLIPLAWALQCVSNETEIAEDEPIYLGVDVARYGEDKSIIMPRKGLRIYPWDTFQGMNTIDLGARVMANFLDMEASGIACDEIGVGAGVTDWLQKRPGGMTTVFGINTANSSSDKNKYVNLRDELWAGMREKCMRQQYWFPGATEKERELSNELCNELAALTYELHGSAIKVESKKQAKMRGVASPNIADALALTEYFSNISYLLWTKTDKHKHQQEKWRRDRSAEENLGSNAWQVY
jgi:phage terminase large subunit